MKVNGQIQAVTSEPRNTKYGTRNVHYITVNGERYQLGFGKLEVKAGDTVSFEEGDKGYGKEVTKGSLVFGGASAVVAAGPDVPAVAAAFVPAPKSGGKAPSVFPIPALSGERAIIRQNALTQARELVVARGLTEGVTNDQYVAEIIRLAPRFEAYSAGDTDMAEAKAEVENK